MRLHVLMFIGTCFLLATFEVADSQLTFGANGLRLPPINLLTVFRILRRTWNSLTKTKKPQEKKELKEEGKSNPSSVLVSRENEIEENTEIRSDDLFTYKSLILDNLEQRINFWCEGDEMDCSDMSLEEFLQETNTTLSEEEESVILKYNIIESLDIPVNEFTGNISKILEGNWEIDVDSSVLEQNSKTDNVLTALEKSSDNKGDSTAVEKSSDNEGDSIGLKKSSGDEGDSTTLEKSSENEVDSTALEKSSDNESDSSLIDMSSKTPSFLPFPFASGAWILSYIALNSVLLGLYLFLAGPYFLTGRTVHILGYEEPPDSYTFYNMNATMPDMENGYGDDEDDDDDDDEHDEQESNGYNGTNGDNEENGHSRENGDNEDNKEYENGNGNNEEVEEEEPYLGYTTYGDLDMMMNYLMNEDENENEHENNGEDMNGHFNGETHDEEIECMENIMCLRPVYGARALSATSLALKLLEWIPGVNNFGSKFKKNINRLDTAVARGRYADCRDYICPKYKKRK